MRVQMVPNQNDRPAELPVRGIQQAGVFGLGEALTTALGRAAVEVDAVDQPGRWSALMQISAAMETRLLPWAVTRTTGVRPAPLAPGAALGRPQDLISFVLEAEPGAQVPRPLFMAGHCSSFQAAIFASLRSVPVSAARPASWVFHPRVR
ncbi:hypothetical protein [Streptomyces sp. NPDC001604]|uniref:hypothetical protein n=1 Tax=Streptomyces sp. NPDC001604 TaxID=3364593 RepID=UPI003693C36D